MPRRGKSCELFNINGSHMRWITAYQGDGLVEEGRAVRLFKPRQHGKPRELLGYKLVPEPGTPRCSAPSITASEMKVNAGLAGHSRTAGLREFQRRYSVNPRTTRVEEEDFIERTQSKVTIWPLAADSKAPLVTRKPDVETLRLAADLERARLGY